jgi:hypothetical protein
VSKKPDIVDVLANLVRYARSPGCNAWLCHIDDELDRARREIVRLRRLEPALFDTTGREKNGSQSCAVVTTAGTDSSAA